MRTRSRTRRPRQQQRRGGAPRRHTTTTTRRTPSRRSKPTHRRRQRKKAPIIPEAPIGGAPPSYFELLQDAVLTLRNERRGVSLPEIRRTLMRKYQGRFDQASNELLTKALERLAQRGKVIYKHGYKYRFNAPKVAKRKPESSETANAPASAGSTYATSATSATSRTSEDDDKDNSGSYTTSYSRSTRSTRSTKRSLPREQELNVGEEKAKEVVVEEAENVDEVKSSGGELSSSVAASVSSLSASRGSSRRRR